MTDLPVPNDIGLQLPLPAGLIKILLVFLFLVHILFVNFMVGCVTLSFIFELLGLKRKKYDDLAHEISKTVTVNKSLAIVLGVAPLLAINLAYTTHFYAATSLTGFAWFMVIPAVTVAFLLTYLHKYTWLQWSGPRKPFHLAVAFMSLAIFWFVPLIFLTNVNLMLFPIRWPQIHGFFSALFLQNVIPRYFHFILATIAVSSFFAVGWFCRKKYPLEKVLPEFDKKELKTLFYKIAFIATMMQFIVGPLVLFTLPVFGIALKVYLWFALGLTSAILVVYVVWLEMKSGNGLIGKQFWLVILLLTTTVIAMAFGRHSYRERAILPHRNLVNQKTEEFYYQSEAARVRERMGISKQEISSEGERNFKKICAVCHAKDYTLVGPSLQEIYQIYENNPQGIVDWSKVPGVKRGGAVMPAFNHLKDDVLQSISEYILTTAQPASN